MIARKPERAAAEAQKARAPRMSPTDREEAIVQGAISFFAEVGFDGQTRELALRLGITQPLIFRYFPTKDDLIERIYQRLYLGRWNPEWEKLIGDRNRPLVARLTDMYRIYVTNVLTSEWVRIFLYSGLKGSLFNKRYIDLIGRRLIAPICAEIEHDNPGLGLPRRQLRELVWGLHGSVFYLGVRKWVYDVAVEDPGATVELLVDGFLANLAARKPADAPAVRRGIRRPGNSVAT